MAHVMPYGGMNGISEDIDKLIAKGFVRQLTTSANVPAGIPLLTIDQLQSRFGSPFYKKWWFWVGAATLVGGGFLLLRRK